MYLRERLERGLLGTRRNGERVALAWEPISEAALLPREEIDRKMDLAAISDQIFRNQRRLNCVCLRFFFGGGGVLPFDKTQWVGFLSCVLCLDVETHDSKPGVVLSPTVLGHVTYLFTGEFGVGLLSTCQNRLLPKTTENSLFLTTSRFLLLNDAEITIYLTSVLPLHVTTINALVLSNNNAKNTKLHAYSNKW